MTLCARAIVVSTGLLAAMAMASPALNEALAFDQTYELEGIGFHIHSANNSSLNLLTITPHGLELDNSPLTVEIAGSISGAEIADLDVDGSPEIYVYVNSAGSGSYGSLVAYAVNNGKSLSEIYLPAVNENDEAANGYMGHDQFAVVENTLVQRFPIYRDGDTNSEPSGGTRQLQYRLEAGEANWVLRLERVVEY